MEALERWIAWGIEPPASRFMDLDTSGAAPAIALDADGNAICGVRTPKIQAPLGRYVETNTGPGFCFLFGGFEAFSEERLAELYPRRFSYIYRLNRAIWQAQRDGFLLRPNSKT